MIAKIIGYPLSNIVIDTHLLQSARKKGIPGDEESFKRSLSRSKPFPFDEVPKDLRWKKFLKKRESYKIDPKRRLIYFVDTNPTTLILRAISVYNYNTHKKTFNLGEMAKFKGRHVEAYI